VGGPYKQGQIANPFSEVQEIWDERRPTIQSRFDLHSTLVNVQKQNQSIAELIELEKVGIEKDKWNLS
jgi:hypothetical protein